MSLPMQQLTLIHVPQDGGGHDSDPLHGSLREFREFGEKTREMVLELPGGMRVPVYVNEFWTAKQRAASRLHEVSYRACFKPQLPRFFITRLTAPGDVIYDPFMGRGTTPLEGALLGRVPAGCDINPLSKMLVEPRLHPPTEAAVTERLAALDLGREVALDDTEDLLAFYHPETLRGIACLRDYLVTGEREGTLDRVDRWIRMVATNRLTGHSPGFFSVYTLPPNQATSAVAQRKINAKRSQIPPVRDIKKIIAKKSKALSSNVTSEELAVLEKVGGKAQFVTGSCDATPVIKSNSISLAVTSPPFLDVVDYETDNWLRCWFNGIDPKAVGIWQLKKPEQWQAKMTDVFRELHRVLKPSGHVAFEVGEVKHGKILLEELVVPAGMDAGLTPVLVLINDQVFTKTSNCWGVDNLSKGTNTNRIVLFRK